MVYGVRLRALRGDVCLALPGPNKQTLLLGVQNDGRRKKKNIQNHHHPLRHGHHHDHHGGGRQKKVFVSVQVSSVALNDASDTLTVR